MVDTRACANSRDCATVDTAIIVPPSASRARRPPMARRDCPNLRSVDRIVNLARRHREHS
eukprot:scaffold294_cov221-Amphora_coffeaeformis.AAC.38